MLGERENMIGRKGSDIIGDDKRKRRCRRRQAVQNRRKWKPRKCESAPIRIQPTGGCCDGEVSVVCLSSSQIRSDFGFLAQKPSLSPLALCPVFRSLYFARRSYTKIMSGRLAGLIVDGLDGIDFVPVWLPLVGEGERDGDSCLRVR
jgi:hypothetical protein